MSVLYACPIFGLAAFLSMLSETGFQMTPLTTASPQEQWVLQDNLPCIDFASSGCCSWFMGLVQERGHTSTLETSNIREDSEYLHHFFTHIHTSFPYIYIKKDKFSLKRRWNWAVEVRPSSKLHTGIKWVGKCTAKGTNVLKTYSKGK